MESSDSPSLKQLLPQRSPRARIARLLLLAVTLLGFLGGPCAMQDVFPVATPIPTRAEYLRSLERTGLLEQSQIAREDLEEMAEASLGFLRAQERTRSRFETPLAVFSFLLAVAYMAVFILAARAFRLGNENVARLSKAALVAMPARVAVAAIELAVVVNTRPALEELFRLLSLKGTVDAPVTGDALLEMSAVLGQGASTAYLALFWIRTILAMGLLYAAHRVFERQDIQELFVREVPEEAPPEDDD